MTKGGNKMARGIDAQEKRWQREDDARTLGRAEEIKVDKKRLAGAKKEAKVMANADDKRLAALRKVASGKVASTKKPARKSSPAKKGAIVNSNTRTSSSIAKKRK